MVAARLLVRTAVVLVAMARRVAWSARAVRTCMRLRVNTRSLVGDSARWCDLGLFDPRVQSITYVRTLEIHRNIFGFQRIFERVASLGACFNFSSALRVELSDVNDNKHSLKQALGPTYLHLPKYDAPFELSSVCFDTCFHELYLIIVSARFISPSVAR